ncbi:MFS transporter [Baekduia sp.]|uniref:MFS transporter n=1 Tax=Baekduia sp. TaxID=2600305 RepID=UPI002D1FB5DA|nr:MFS transporter [Baekduia sp.]
MLPAVLREERQFRLLFLGQALSVVGDRMTQVVLPFAVLSIGGSVTDVGIVAAAGFLPFIFLGLVGGVIADRVERRRILVASDLVRLASQGIAGLLLVTGQAEIWHLAVLTAIFGAADSFFSPAFSGLMPLTISAPHHLQPANALRGMSFSTGSIVGPALGGILVAALGEGGALLVDAGTFGVSVLCLLALRPRVVERGDPEPFAADLKGGWREVRTRSWVWSFLLAMIAYHVVVLPSIYVLGPVLMEDELDGATSWAIIVTAFGLGSIVADLLLLRWRPRFALRAAAIALMLASCQAVIIGSGLPILAIAAVEFCAAIGVSAFFALWETSLQEHIPEGSLSRVSSYDYVASAGMMPLGIIVAGPVAEAVGIHETLTAMTVIGVAAAIGCLAVRSVRDLPRSPLKMALRPAAAVDTSPDRHPIP